MDNIISLKTSFPAYYLQWVRDTSAKAGSLVSETVLCIFPAIY